MLLHEFGLVIQANKIMAIGVKWEEKGGKFVCLFLEYSWK